MRKILSSVMIIGLTVTMLGAGTFSYFSDIEISTGNTFTAGTIDLKIDCDSYWWRDAPQGPIEMGSISFPERDLTIEKFFDWGDLKPGDFGEVTISLHVYENDAWLWLHIDNSEEGPGITTEGEPLPDNGELAENMPVLLWIDHGAHPGFGNDPVEWNCNGGGCGEGVVVHTYGEDEQTGTVEIPRSDGTTPTYDYEAKPTCVKFEDGDPQLGEDETVGLTDTFVITFYGGALPINGEIKTGADAPGPDGTPFTITYVGEEIGIYYYNTLTYKIRLVDICDSTFTFEVESIAKPGNTALSHIEFCFSPGDPGGECEGGEGDNIWQEGYEPVLFEGTMRELIDAYSSEWLAYPDPIESCVVYYIGWSWEIPGAVGNEIQGDTLTFDVEFYVEQYAGNP